jgi:hypothetical protein
MIKVKQLFSTFHASFVFLKNAGTGPSLSHVFPPPAHNCIPVSLAFEKFPQTHAVLNLFVPARPFIPRQPLIPPAQLETTVKHMIERLCQQGC